MEFFKWKESFKIGVDEIDQQHQWFLERLNHCHDHVSQNQGTCLDLDLVSGLREYAAIHFRYEEDLMRSRDYPKIAQHQSQHRYFESQVLELEAAWSGGRKRLPESILPFLRDWFLNHILEQDRKIVPYLG